MWGEGLVRLSAALRASGGQGQPYGDDVVAQARALVERTILTQKEIGARIGVSHMTICRWARSGGWRRPLAAARPLDELGSASAATERFVIRTEPWRRLRTAEAILDVLESQPTADLADIERALDLLLAARKAAAVPVPRTRWTGSRLVHASRRRFAPPQHDEG